MHMAWLLIPKDLHKKLKGFLSFSNNWMDFLFANNTIAILLASVGLFFKDLIFFGIIVFCIRDGYVCLFSWSKNLPILFMIVKCDGFLCIHCCKRFLLCDYLLQLCFFSINYLRFCISTRFNLFLLIRLI